MCWCMQKLKLTARCGDMDREVCPLACHPLHTPNYRPSPSQMIHHLGVSKAILNHVIFCHQEESTWSVPLLHSVTLSLCLSLPVCVCVCVCVCVVCVCCVLCVCVCVCVCCVCVCVSVYVQASE